MSQHDLLPNGHSDREGASRLPSVKVNPNVSGLSKIRPPGSISRLPKLRLNSAVDSSLLQSPIHVGAAKKNAENMHGAVSPNSDKVFTDEPVNSMKLSQRVKFSNLKRKSSGESPLSKKIKTEDSRVAAVKASISKKAARRSIHKALKITRKKAMKEAVGNPTAKRGISAVKQPPRALKNPALPMKKVVNKATNVKSQRPTVTATLRNKSANANSNLTTSSKTNASGKKTSSLQKKSSESSISGRGSGGEKKTLRKPWDLRGQVEDLKGELTKANEKGALIDDILTRINALETENKNIYVEKKALTTNVSKGQQELTDLRQLIDENEREFQGKLHRLNLENEDCKHQIQVLQRSRDDIDLECRKLRREKLDAGDHIADLNRTCKLKTDENFELSGELKNLKHKLQEVLANNQRLQQENREFEIDRRRLLNDVQELKGNIRVFCRVRPMLASEIQEQGNIDHIELTGKSINVINESNKTLKYSFDNVFNPEVSQEAVFEDIAQLVQSALDGYNVCIFAYGQTGAGKTYTMEGPDDNTGSEHEGIIPRAMRLIFEKGEEKRKFDWNYDLVVQHVEIYREILQDLLDPRGDLNKKLEIKTVTKSGKGQSVWVKNLSEHPVSQFRQVYNLLKQAKKNRATAATNANERSSRSHSVFMLKIKGHNVESGEITESSLNLIDLAGSERVAETGSSGTRLKEAQKINGSLSELSNVISSLANKDKHIPFRNSKLTFLLMDSLGGNSKTLMLVNVNPTRRATAETINTLRFATTVNKCHIGTAQKVIKFD
ncbi:carboxy-terminal kinesin 2-like [Clavelina lepadiformis]|uniref:carboxy-terminal kinesin 2-like n=1 Tax=Clavelina lepadiformis TaxID=159417 RepID=UPI004041CC64